MPYKSVRQYSNEAHVIPSASDHPLTYCMSSTYDVKFNQGGIGHMYGPRSRPCQMYMSDRCARDWDGYCEYFYQENSRKDEWPQNKAWPDEIGGATALPENVQLTIGDQLLRNTAMKKYCGFADTPECSVRCEKFDPLKPDSYTLKYAVGKCIPVCGHIDPKTIDQDPVMDRMLANPKPVWDLLTNICYTTQREGTNLNGTKLGKYRDALFKLVEQQQIQHSSQHS